MEELSLIKDAAGLIEKNFYFDSLKDELPLSASEAYEALRKFLAERIAYMLNEDFETLMQVFYRIDLKETKVRDILFGGDPSPAFTLADLVIERQLEKARSRAKYREQYGQ